MDNKLDFSKLHLRNSNEHVLGPLLGDPLLAGVTPGTHFAGRLHTGYGRQIAHKSFTCSSLRRIYSLNRNTTGYRHPTRCRAESAIERGKNRTHDAPSLSQGGV